MFSADALAGQVHRLERAFSRLRVRHLWSYKTLSLGPAVAWWRRRGGWIEVVSEFEFLAAKRLGFHADEIVVNGPAKDRWLGPQSPRRLRVNFDSLSELEALAPVAARRRWQVGLRFQTSSEWNPDYPEVRTQFGFLRAEIPTALRMLRQWGLEPEVVHFHLRTNVAHAGEYRRGIQEALEAAEEGGWRPRVLDMGGGIPAESVRDPHGRLFDARFTLSSVRQAVASVLERHAYLEEVWMENGRWLAAPAAVLAIRVLDVKEDRGVRILICDGGRTLQALVATWERHAVVPLPRRGGTTVPTLICGPTCMAFDHLGVHRLAEGIARNDVLFWRNAGAYQLAWETGFSHGRTAIGWVENGRPRMVRRAERFPEWFRSRAGGAAVWK